MDIVNKEFLREELPNVDLREPSKVREVAGRSQVRVHIPRDGDPETSAGTSVDVAELAALDDGADDCLDLSALHWQRMRLDFLP